jgi:hypothetical protein
LRQIKKQWRNESKMRKTIIGLILAALMLVGMATASELMR